MRRMVLWDTACNFNGSISNQSIFNCLITGASTLHIYTHSLSLSLSLSCDHVVALLEYNSLHIIIMSSNDHFIILFYYCWSITCPCIPTLVLVALLFRWLHVLCSCNKLSLYPLSHDTHWVQWPLSFVSLMHVALPLNYVLTSRCDSV